ncbi:MAG: PAC2 family protein [Cellulomonadaceae bacterium]
MLEPSGIYTIDEETAATLPSGQTGHAGQSGPVLVHALRGFVDAGATTEQVTDHVLAQFSAQRLATFDTDQLLDYRSRRPTMVLESDRWARYDAPELAIDLLHDEEGTAFLLLHGLEPDLQWERFVAATTRIIERFDVSLVVGVQGIPMAVPHTRPLGSSAHGTRDELLLPQPNVFGTVTVPGSASALLEYRLGEAGRDAVGFAVHVPHYLAQGQFAPAALEALEQVQRVTGLTLDAQPLREAAQESRAEIDRQMAESAEVQGVVHALEGQYDTFVQRMGRTSLLAETEPLPSGDELAAQFEQFLAEQDEGPADAWDGSGNDA